MTNDEQDRQRLVEIALEAAESSAKQWTATTLIHPLAVAWLVRARAGFRNPSKGHWCAAGLTAAMDDAGLVVPEPGTPARRGAIALLDWVGGSRALPPGTSTQWVAMPGVCRRVIAGEAALPDAMPGDIIAWLQHPPPDPAGWRRGHVAVIVAVDDESITTVGWNEGKAPGRVMKRQLWRDPEQHCNNCYQRGSGEILVRVPNTNRTEKQRCPGCRGAGRVRPSETVLYRRPGGLYGIARPVAR